jgi:osmotically inducible protein OsmC
MLRKGFAVWTGSAKDGNGELSTQSETLKDTPYTFDDRFGQGKGTNPEELIAAAHAGCFTMALAFKLAHERFTPEGINTAATLKMEQVNGAWTITSIDLETRARIPGIDAKKFQELAADAKANCPVSRLLNAKITLHAALEE